jgi:hypothetical protein
MLALSLLVISHQYLWEITQLALITFYQQVDALVTAAVFLLQLFYADFISLSTARAHLETLLPPSSHSLRQKIYQHMVKP